MDEFGNETRRGYAFVIHTSSQTSELLTDYDLVVDALRQGNDKVDLDHGGQSFTATVLAVTTEPHVALLRIPGEFPSLSISVSTPKTGDTVTLGEPGSSGLRDGAVVAYSGRGSAEHLTFSVEVPDVDDGAPVLNSAGKVVGIAEPSTPFHVSGIGFAMPILRACQAVGVC